MALAGDDCQHQELGGRALGEQGVQIVGQPLPWGTHLPGQTAHALPRVRSSRTVGTRVGWGGCERS